MEVAKITLDVVGGQVECTVHCRDGRQLIVTGKEHQTRGNRLHAVALKRDRCCQGSMFLVIFVAGKAPLYKGNLRWTDLNIFAECHDRMLSDYEIWHGLCMEAGIDVPAGLAKAPEFCRIKIVAVSKVACVHCSKYKFPTSDAIKDGRRRTLAEEAIFVPSPTKIWLSHIPSEDELATEPFEPLRTRPRCRRKLLKARYQEEVEEEASCSILADADYLNTYWKGHKVDAKKDASSSDEADLQSSCSLLDPQLERKGYCKGSTGLTRAPTFHGTMSLLADTSSESSREPSPMPSGRSPILYTKPVRLVRADSEPNAGASKFHVSSGPTSESSAM